MLDTPRLQFLRLGQATRRLGFRAACRSLPLVMAAALSVSLTDSAQAQNPPVNYPWFAPTSFWKKKTITEPSAADQTPATMLKNQFLYKIYKANDPEWKYGQWNEDHTVWTPYNNYYTQTHSRTSGTVLRSTTFPQDPRTNFGNTAAVWTAAAGQGTINVPHPTTGVVNPAFATNVPFPSNWVMNDAPDKPTIIWQPNTNTIWDFWLADGIYPNITAKWGGKMTGITTSEGVYPYPYGTSASGFVLGGGMITRYEAWQISLNPTSSANLIPHPLALVLPEIADYHVAPANRHDGPPSAGIYPVAEGTRFRLPANVTVPASPPLLRAIVIAARDYGLVVRDGSDSIISICGELNKPGDIDYWAGIRGGVATYSILDAFPWSQLQALNPTDVSPGEVRVDNTDATGVTTTGTWSASTTTMGYYGSNYWHDGNANKGSSTVRYNPTLPSAGSYEVFMRWTADSGRAPNVSIDINAAAGLITNAATVNQQVNNGEWISVGTYTFNAGTAGYLKIKNAGTTGYVIADAVKFVPVAATPGVITMDSENTTGITTAGTWLTGTTTGGYIGTNYWFNGAANTAIRYTPTITTAGTYKVYARWTAGYNRATNTPIVVYHTAGSSTVNVDQTINGGVWVLLGTYAFNAGASTANGSVRISDLGANGIIIADGIKFEKQ